MEKGFENKEKKEIHHNTILYGPESGELFVGNTVIFKLVEDLPLDGHESAVQIVKIEKRSDNVYFIEGLLSPTSSEERPCEITYDVGGYEIEGEDYYGEIKVLPSVSFKRAD